MAHKSRSFSIGAVSLGDIYGFGTRRCGEQRSAERDIHQNAHDAALPGPATSKRNPRARATDFGQGQADWLAEVGGGRYRLVPKPPARGFRGPTGCYTFAGGGRNR